MNKDPALIDIIDTLTIRQNILLYSLFEGAPVHVSQMLPEDKELYDAYTQAINAIKIIIEKSN